MATHPGHRRIAADAFPLAARAHAGDPGGKRVSRVLPDLAGYSVDEGSSTCSLVRIRFVRGTVPPALAA